MMKKNFKIEYPYYLISHEYFENKKQFITETIKAFNLIEYTFL